jgi:hypothetical protein
LAFWELTRGGNAFRLTFGLGVNGILIIEPRAGSKVLLLLDIQVLASVWKYGGYGMALFGARGFDFPERTRNKTA